MRVSLTHSRFMATNISSLLGLIQEQLDVEDTRVSRTHSSSCLRQRFFPPMPAVHEDELILARGCEQTRISLGFEVGLLVEIP